MPLPPVARFIAVAAVGLFAGGLAWAAEDAAVTSPPALSVLQEIKPVSTTDTVRSIEIRKDALREAALSYGARGGLSRRTWHIRHQLSAHDAALSKTFDFRQLLISAPSGLLIEPPIITEGERALIVSEEGQTANMADRVYRINQQARIVTAARDWRTYLERDWGEVPPPPDLLLPKTDEEREAWRAWINEGWEEGIKQADEIFQADLDMLMRDFTGMIRYRELLAQGMVSPPYALLEDNGVTGGGQELRVGDRGVRITGPAELEARSERWTPVER